MLAGHLSNQDEEDVESELEDLQREVAEPNLPTVPTDEPPVEEPEQEEPTTEQAKAKAKTQTPMLSA